MPWRSSGRILGGIVAPWPPLRTTGIARAHFGDSSVRLSEMNLTPFRTELRDRPLWRFLLWMLAVSSFAITLVFAWWAVQAAWLSAFEYADVGRLRVAFWVRMGLAIVFFAGTIASVIGAVRAKPRQP